MMKIATIINWRVFAEEIANGLHPEVAKQLRDAVRAYNRLEAKISYSEYMSSLIDFGEFPGSTFDDDREQALNYVAKRFGIQEKHDIFCMEAEDLNNYNRHEIIGTQS